MSKSKYGIISLLDIGSTKIVCFIVRMDSAGNSEVIGIGHQSSQGFRAGNITDIKLAESSILSAIEAAEQMAEENIEKIIVNISGKIFSHHLVIHSSLASMPLTDRDLARIIAEGQEHYHQPDVEVIHTVPLDYSIDGTEGIKDPIGMVGKKLTGKLNLVTTPSTSVVNLVNCMARCQLTVADFTVSPYMAGLACLTPDEMELGSTIIDMGGGTTSFALFKGGAMLYADSIPIGGRHVTSDIAHGLSTDMQSAERTKTLDGHAIATSADSKIMINVPYIGEEDDSGIHTIPRALLVEIIIPRIEEILEMVRDRINASGFAPLASNNIVITGGASQLMGLKELSSNIFGKHVRIGYPKSIDGLEESTKGAAFSTIIGMVVYASERVRQKQTGLNDNEEGSGRIGRILSWLQKNF